MDKIITIEESCQTNSPLVNDLNTLYSTSKFSSNLETGEVYSDLKSEHHYLNDSINSKVLKKNTIKEIPKGIWRVSM